MQDKSYHSNRIDFNDKDNPALSNVIERNIRTLIHLRLKEASTRSLKDRIADLE